MANFNGSVSPETIIKVKQIGCENGIAMIPFNYGRKLPCVEWTRRESTLYTLSAIATSDLMESGLFTRVSTSGMGMDASAQNGPMASNTELLVGAINRANILNGGIYLDTSRLDIGEVQTRNSGVNYDCTYTMNPILWDKMRKTFYLVPTELNSQICPADLLGTEASRYIGVSRADFDPEVFQNTEFYMILAGQVMEKYMKWFPKFMVMAVDNGPAENANGHDGILAQQYFANKRKMYDVMQYDMSAIVNDNKNIMAISNGGSKYTKLATEFLNPTQYLFDFVEWLNSQYETTGNAIYNAVISTTSSKITLYAVGKRDDKALVDLHILATDAITVDWKCISTNKEHVPVVQLEKAPIVNEQPLMRPYEKIDSTNFLQYFYKLMQDIEDKLLTTGLGQKVSMNDLRILIDPRLMLAHGEQIANRQLSLNGSNNDPTGLLLDMNKFIPFNEFNGTGLFLFGFRGVFIMFDDAGDIIYGGGDNNMRIDHVNDPNAQTRMVQLFSGVRSFGVSAFNWALTGSNFIGSPTFTAYDMTNREPCEYTKGQWNCYDDSVTCLRNAKCSLEAYASVTPSYNSVDDTTEFVVDIDTIVNKTDVTKEFSWMWSTSNGSASTVALTDENSTVVLPGNLLNTGIVFSVMGTANALEDGTVSCSNQFYARAKLGSGDGLQQCTFTLTEDYSTSDLNGSGISVAYSVQGVSETAQLTDQALDPQNPADIPALEAEFDALFATTGTTIEANGTNITFTIPNVDEVVVVDYLFNTGAPIEQSGSFTSSC